MCPQNGVAASSYSEDCLYFVAYVPSNATPVSFSGGAPVLVWIHGGSYNSGSASDPVIDGSKLAEATGSVVVVIQYRLGIFGYLPPASLSANKNLGVQDVMTALKYIQNVIGSVGGDKSQIVLAAQSSGGNMIRNLLATPSASGLFSRAIIQSDPMVRSLLPLTRLYLILAVVELWLPGSINVHKSPKRLLWQRLLWILPDNPHQQSPSHSKHYLKQRAKYRSRYRLRRTNPTSPRRITHSVQPNNNVPSNQQEYPRDHGQRRGRPSYLRWYSRPSTVRIFQLRRPNHLWCLARGRGRGVLPNH